MDAIKQYLLSVTAAAMICGIIKGFIGDKGMTSKVLGLLSGLFLTFCTIAPIIDFDRIDFSGFGNAFLDEADTAVLYGESLANDARREIIIENTTSYILDKANTLELDIEVEVTLDSNTSVPIGVCIDGDVSPYAKNTLSNFMEESLGIAKENQVWT